MDIKASQNPWSSGQGITFWGDEEDYKGKLQKVVFCFFAIRGFCKERSYNTYK